MEERLIVGVAKGEITKWSPELFEHISNQLVKAVQMGFKRPINNADLDFTYAAQDDAYITALEINIYRFSAGKTLAQVQALNQAFRESKSFSDFKKRAKIVEDKFERWAETEYNTALACAEQASTYQRLKRMKKLYPYWQYRTIGDSQVRKEHAELDGVILHHQHDKWKEIYPPNGWGCRCYVIPLMEHDINKGMLADSAKKVAAYQETTDWEKVKEQGWGINRADKRIAFTANQQYIRKTFNRELNSLYYNDYGLEDFDTKRNKGESPETDDYLGTPEEWYNDNNSILTDYRGRRVTINSNVFNFHTTGSHKNRVPLLNYIRDVLSSPDEVWLNSDKKTGDSINYIRFYKGKVINVICELVDGQEYQIKTWFEITPTPNLKKKPENKKLDPRLKYRRGLLIHLKQEEASK